MKTKLAILLLLTAAALTGCGSDNNGNNTEKSNNASQPINGQTAAPSKAPKKLSAAENVALDYVNIFLNGSDEEAKKTFIQDHVYPDAQPLFQLAQAIETPDDHKLKDPQVIESADYSGDDNMKVEAVLIQGEEGNNPQSELIVFITDKKVLMASDSSDEESFGQARSAFKTPVPETSQAANEPSEKDMLREIKSFVIDDLWNDAFVEISWYINSGTSSTGESIDINFTVQQLGKTMEKKKEYDAYMSGLGTEYDSVKSVWAKLSGEADRLYALIQQHPPKANDSSSDYDASILNQYTDAFEKEVDALTE